MSSVASISPPRLAQINQLLQSSGYGEAELLPLAGDASFRRYIRIREPHRSAMLMDAPPGKEDVRPYMAIAQHLHGKGYSAPRILAQDASAGLLLLEDLGDDSFSAVVKAGKAPEPVLYSHAIDLLAECHNAGESFAAPRHLPLPAYDHGLLLQEIGLFPTWYLPQVLGKQEAAALQQEYTQLWGDILAAAPLAMQSWVHRDYHADNLMWLPSRDGVKRVGLLDFQDGVYGDPAYDMVSLLEDARRDVPPALAQSMIDRYLASTGADRERFLTAYAILGAQRNSKIIGIFSRLAARDNKFAYLNLLPRVWGHLERDLAHPALQPLKQWLEKHVPASQRGVITVRHTSQELLTA